MKIIVHEKGIIMAGKAWEIREKLKKYQKDYHFVAEWINSNIPKSKS